LSDRSQLTGQGVRFLLVGGYNVAFTLAVFWLLDHFWGETIGVQAVYWTSAVLGVVNGFIAQRLFVWKSRGAWRGELVKFFVLNAAVSAVNSLLLFLTVTLWHLPAFPSQVVITGLLTLTSFFVSRNWVFRTMHTSEEPRPHDD
jgi:putative flippase GtrA